MPETLVHRRDKLVTKGTRKGAALVSNMYLRQEDQDHDFALYLVEQIGRWGRPLAQVDFAAARILSDGGRFILAPLIERADDGAILEVLDAMEELGLLGGLPFPRRARAGRSPWRRGRA